MGTPFTEDVIAAVMRHMNDDHAADSVVICQGAGGLPDATAARMTGMDEGGIEFEVTTGGGRTTARIPWSGPITERAQVRQEVVRMFEESRAALDAEKPGT